MPFLRLGGTDMTFRLIELQENEPLLSKLLDETSAGDESARIRVSGSAMLEVWPWSLFARARGARRPTSKAFK